MEQVSGQIFYFVVAQVYEFQRFAVREDVGTEGLDFISFQVQSSQLSESFEVIASDKRHQSVGSLEIGQLRKLFSNLAGKEVNVFAINDGKPKNCIVR